MINDVKEITNQDGVDIIYDPIGGEYFLKSLKVIFFIYEKKSKKIRFYAKRMEQHESN